MNSSQNNSRHDNARHDIKPGRLDKERIDRNYSDLHPPLTPHQAAVESDRCLF